VFERPTHFADVMLRGAFGRMEHHHYFEHATNGTLMRDVFSFQSPLGVLGHIADVLFLTRYMKSFLIERNRVIKATAESDDWKQYIRNTESK
jgi:ligand-binding SRPBCC domain-containing protein